VGKLKCRMTKEWNIKSQYLIVVGVISLFLVVGSFSYALFTTSTESKGTLNIAAGTLYSSLESSELDKSHSVTLVANETKTVTITLKNINTIEAKFNLWYTPVEGVSISYDVSRDTPPTKEGESFSIDSKKVYQLNITNHTSEEQKITFGSDVGLMNKPLLFPSDKKEITGRNLISVLKGKINDRTKSYESATEEEKKEMFTFDHERGAQQTEWSEEELTDYRYIGTKPNNYVTFNDELWRIIGVFTVEDEKGKKEERVKLIREESLGNYSWDNIGEYGENNWSTSSLEYVLNNEPYYNRSRGICPGGQNGASLLCDFRERGLTDIARNMIASTKWYLGGSSIYGTSIKFYEYERGTTVYSGRPTSWVGKVGLMYPSDYGYAASGSNCLSTNLASYGSSCASTDWLYNASIYQWTIIPYPGNQNYILYVRSSDLVSNGTACNAYAVRPNVYLKSSVIVSSGDGSRENSYKLEI